MRDQVLLHINGRPHQVASRRALLSLSDFLRHELRLVGTKIVCSEGDCGACTVLIGRVRDGRLQYHCVDSCIQFMFQLDGTHVVSVEGLSPDGQLSAVQQAMVDCHGSQCGFCTPGFVVAMAGMLEERQRLDEAEMRYGLTGNLCRCTGYIPIIEAGAALDDQATDAWKICIRRRRCSRSLPRRPGTHRTFRDLRRSPAFAVQACRRGFGRRFSRRAP